MGLQVINPITWKGWDHLVLGLPNASFFYSSAWAQVLQDSYGYTPMFFAVLDGGGRFLLPMMDIRSRLSGHRGVSLPFTDFCAPYVSGDSRFDDLFGEVVRTGKEVGWSSIEIRGGQKYFVQKNPSRTYYLHTLKLGNEPALLAQMKESCRRNIKTAVTNGVQIVADRSADAMREFYRLQCITRRKHGVPPQPYQFFKHVYDRIIQNDMGIIIRALWKDQTVAAAVFFHFGEHALYKYGASDIAHLPLRANNLMMWEAIRYYATRGFQNLDLGKTETGNEGLRRYKAAWGADERTVMYYRYDLKDGCFKTDRPSEKGWHTKVFSKMPLPLLTATGRFMYRHIG